MRRSHLLLWFIFFLIEVNAQSSLINWKNPSFEGVPLQGSVPAGWESHSFEGQTPPDTQPCNYGGVSQTAANGNTYLGLIVLENNSWESVGQLLDSVLLSGRSYEFTMLACRSYRYYQPSGRDSEITNASKPVLLRLWGGTYEKPFLELLDETDPVSTTDWELQTFTFTPRTDINYLTFEAYYDRSSAYAYNGNILIDDLSPVYRKTNPRKPPSGMNRAESLVRNENPQQNHYYAQEQPKRAADLYYNNGRMKPHKREDLSDSRFSRHDRLNRRELIIQAQQEMEAAKRDDGEKKENIMLYDDPTIIERKLNRQNPYLKDMPSNAESIHIPGEIRGPIIRIGPQVLSFVYQVDQAILVELATMMQQWEGHTLIIAVHAPQQGVRDKLAWELDIARQELNIDEKLITIEQYTGQNTYFKDWLWKPEGKRVMMRLVAKKG